MNLKELSKVIVALMLPTRVHHRVLQEKIDAVEALLECHVVKKPAPCEGLTPTRKLPFNVGDMVVGDFGGETDLIGKKGVIIEIINYKQAIVEFDHDHPSITRAVAFDEISHAS
jgi:hypothetical protein